MFQLDGDCWLTDLVKVFLYKKEHLESCKAAVPDFKVQVLRDKFWEMGNKSLNWLQEEIQLCQPKVIVTLGLEVAQVVSSKKSSKPDNLNGIPTVYAPHPDACRRFKKWRDVMANRVELIKVVLKI